jgi:UDP-N-acetylglucosamine:LPS N-acetylglucosamine transferase
MGEPFTPESRLQSCHGWRIEPPRFGRDSLLGSGDQADRVCCVRGKQTRFPMRCVDQRARASSAKIVISRYRRSISTAATEIPHERVAETDHPCRTESFEIAHRPQPGLQTPVVGFDGIIAVLFAGGARRRAPMRLRRG